MKIIDRRAISQPGEPIIRAAYSPTGRWIVAGGGFLHQATTFVVRDSRTLEPRQSFLSEESSLGVLAFLPDDRTLLSSGYVSDGVESWDVEEGRRLGRLRILPTPYRKSPAGHLLTATHVGDLAISKDGALVALACWDCSAKVVDWASGEIRELAHRKDNVDFLALGPGEARLFTGTYRQIFEWETSGWTLRRTIDCGPAEHWTHHAVDGGARIASLSDRGRLVIRDLAHGTAEEFKISIKGPPACMADSSKDGLLAIGRKDGSALFWDTKARKLAGRLKLADDYLLTLAFAPDRPAILAVHGGDGPRLVEFTWT